MRTDEAYLARPDGTKRCFKCDRVKPVSAFYVRRGGDGFRNDCRDCVAAKSREWYAANSEKAKERVTKWQRDNPERTRENKARSERARRAADPKRYRAANRAYQKRHPEVAAYRMRSRALAQYGLTHETYAELLASQNGVCAICSGPPGGRGVNFHVDHCHATGRVRGLLCHSCNTSLGHFRDDPELLRRAIRYIGG